MPESDVAGPSSNPIKTKEISKCNFAQEMKILDEMNSGEGGGG